MRTITIDKFFNHKDKIAILIESKEELEKYCHLANSTGITNFILIEYIEPLLVFNTGSWQRLCDYENRFKKPENRLLKRYTIYKLKE